MNGFAVRNDGMPGWRAVGSDDELLPNEVFTEVEPPPLIQIPPGIGELTLQAKEARDKLLAIAANRMGPLQDAVDTHTATEEEIACLALWRQYRIALNRIEGQSDFPTEILWPLSPDEASTTD